MTDETLKDLLSDILLQQQNILKTVEIINKKCELVQAANSQNFNSSKVVEEQVNFANQFLRVLKSRMKQMETISSQIPKQIEVVKCQETKFVLFSKKSEEGHYGLKDLLRGFYCFLAFCFVLYVSIKYIPNYIGDAKENLAYKQTLQWFFYKSDKRSRDAIQASLNHFINGDTSYTNELKRFQINSRN